MLPCVFKVNKPGIQADGILCLCKILAYSPFLESQSPLNWGFSPHFLSALASNNQFIMKLVKMWPGGGVRNFEDKVRKKTPQKVQSFLTFEKLSILFPTIPCLVS